MSKMYKLDFMHYCSIDSDFKQAARIGDMNPFTINSHCHVTEELNRYTTMFHFNGVHTVHFRCCSTWSFMEENFNIMLHVSKQGIGAIASQLKIQPIKSDNMSR